MLKRKLYRTQHGAELMDRSTLRRNPETDRVDFLGWSFLTRVYRIICIVGLRCPGT
jgi:hypothetical protein